MSTRVVGIAMSGRAGPRTRAWQFDVRQLSLSGLGFTTDWGRFVIAIWVVYLSRVEV